MKIAFTIFIFMFILLRPYTVTGSGFWYYGDDQDYFAHDTSIVFGQFPSYRNEYMTIDGHYPQSSIGSSLLSLPFVWAFSLIDRCLGSSIVLHRTADNIPGSWSEFGFALASCFYFSLGCILLYKGALYFVEERYAFLSITLTALCQGLPLFVVRRPIFSHAAEFFLQSIFVFLILRNITTSQKFPRIWWHYLLLGILGALTYLTRYNNIGFAGVAPIVLLISSNFTVKKWKSLLLIFASVFVMIAIFKIWPESYNKTHVYTWIKEYLLINVTPVQLGKRVLHILFGLDWGLIYSAPYILIGLAAFFLSNFPGKKYFLWLLIALIINFYIIMIWGSQGGWYGYRYLLAATIPLLVLPVAILFKNAEAFFKKNLTLCWVLLSIPPALSMFCFEGNDSTLDLRLTPQDFGHTDITNNLYQFHVWETFLFQPMFFLNILCKGGGQYIAFLFTHLLQKIGLFSNAYFRNYTSFDPILLIKVILIYTVPFLTAWILMKHPKHE